MCCEESQVETLEVASDGSATLTSYENGEEQEVSTAIISVSGTDITMEITDEDAPTYNGILSISGNIATFTFYIDESDLGYYGYTDMGMEVTATMIILWERQDS